MKILVTGGGGFLGTHLIYALKKRNFEIVNFSRSLYPHLEKEGIHTIQGDIRNLNDCREALEGIDAIFHVASKVSMWGKWQDFYDINFLGTKNILEAAKEKGIKKFIYTSTPSVVFGNQDLLGVDESTPYPKKSISMYAKSKRLAEEYVLKSNGTKIKTVALRPHLIFGPGDKNLIPRLISAYKEGRLKKIGLGKNLVDVIFIENAVDAHLLAFDKLEKVNGEAFFIGQEKPVNLWDFINQLLKINKLGPVKGRVPYSLAYFIGLILECGSILFKKYNWEPPMTRFVAMQLSKSHYFNHSKTKNLLGHIPKISIEQALQIMEKV